MNKTLIAVIVVIVVIIAGVVLYERNSGAMVADQAAVGAASTTGEWSATNAANATDTSAQDETMDMSGQGAEATEPVPAAPAQEGTNVGVSAGASAGTAAPAEKDFTITGQNFSMTPASLTVNKGDKVKITFTNANGTHDLHLDGYNLTTSVLQTGQSQTLEFTADKSGTFSYYCTIGNHRAMGMEGTLTVK